ncbi:MAG: hypothetical protein K8H88_00745 [Sandaracinaceae bacterium]|nr:hypothetical protein [Sandaracinaceae bacterium]
MRSRFALILFLFAMPLSAHAQRGPRIASDGLFIGARLEPGAALAVGWDLDVYVTGDRALSLGPAITFAFLGEDGVDLGRRQDFLFAVDALRFKASMMPNSEIRPYVFLGGGFYYAQLPAQQSGPRTVLVLPDRTPAMALLDYAYREAAGGLLSGGIGFDGYLTSSFGLSVVVAAHIRLSDDDRVPLAWADAMLGIRFGL